MLQLRGANSQPFAPAAHGGEGAGPPTWRVSPGLAVPRQAEQGRGREERPYRPSPGSPWPPATYTLKSVHEGDTGDGLSLSATRPSLQATSESAPGPWPPWTCRHAQGHGMFMGGVDTSPPTQGFQKKETGWDGRVFPIGRGGGQTCLVQTFSVSPVTPGWQGRGLGCLGPAHLPSCPAGLTASRTHSTPGDRLDPGELGWEARRLPFGEGTTAERQEYPQRQATLRVRP